MSYTTPPTFAAGDILEADQLNVLGDDIADLDSRVAGVVTSAMQISRTTNQSIPDSTDTYISFPIENLDIGGWFPGSGTTVTVPAGAVPAGATTIALWLTGSAKFATNGTGTRRIEIHVNGSSIGGQNVPGLSGDNTIVYIAGELAVVAAGDTIKLSASQTSGGALNVLTAKLQFHRIGVVS